MLTGLSIAAVLMMFWPHFAHALLPPDMLFSVGSSMVQFFSIIALVVGSVFSGVVLTARRWIVLSTTKTFLIIGVIVGLVGLFVVAIYVSDIEKKQAQNIAHIVELETANFGLEKQLKESVPKSEYEQTLAYISEHASSCMPVIIVPTSTTTGFERKFQSDNIVLYSADDNFPFSLELDFNRIETRGGVFTHYTYMSGSYGSETFSDYDTVYATTSTLMPNRYVKSIDRTIAEDLSTRDVYHGSVLVQGEPIDFEISNLTGDFITRHRMDHTQYQSVGTAFVTFRGVRYEVQALVEGAHSIDYTEHIFFPGYEQVDSTTHQFVLWDEDRNFFLIDISEVRSNTPQYPSHVWLLFKDGAGAYVKKSFTASISSVIDESGRVTWRISAPEFKQATIELSPVLPYKQVGTDRIRSVVNGSISDTDGKRVIGGLLHMIE